MTQLNQIYKCNICGNITEVLHSGVGQLVCCNQPMELLVAKNKDEGFEKHLPVVNELPPNMCSDRDGFEIKIGETEHPMQPDHYIEWVEVNTIDGKSGKKFLEPKEKPMVVFYTRKKLVSVRIYCNIHGLWEKKL
ncbi:MAG: desulfoferrodoxin [Candidatus Pacebacteria bacterium]|nr:desulfoferrodoxin [Candidatus Paceibacterota bacterium]